MSFPDISLMKCKQYKKAFIPYKDSIRRLNFATIMQILCTHSEHVIFYTVIDVQEYSKIILLMNRFRFLGHCQIPWVFPDILYFCLIPWVFPVWKNGNSISLISMISLSGWEPWGCDNLIMASAIKPINHPE